MRTHRGFRAAIVEWLGQQAALAVSYDGSKATAQAGGYQFNRCEDRRSPALVLFSQKGSHPLNVIKQTLSFPAFRSRNYRLFFAGQGLSLVGTWITMVA